MQREAKADPTGAWKGPSRFPREVFLAKQPKQDEGGSEDFVCVVNGPRVKRICRWIPEIPHSPSRF
jgi:hypothetical protein